MWFCICGPVTSTFWPNINWLARYRDGLSLCQVWRFWFQPFWFYVRTNRITHTDRQKHRRGWSLYSRDYTVGVSNNAAVSVTIMPRLHQDTCCPDTSCIHLYSLVSLAAVCMYLVSATKLSSRRHVSICIRIEVARPGHLYPATCIPV